MRKFLFTVATVFAPLTAQAAEGINLSTGFDYSSGKYGGSVPTEISSAFLTAKYEQGPLTLRLTVPYLEIRGPATGALGRDTVTIGPRAGDRGKVSGLGDLVAGVGYFAWQDAQSGLALDVGGKLKLPTADSAKGLGTGKSDESLLINVYKTSGRTTLMAGAAYKWMGKPDGSNFRDVASAFVGVSHGLSDETSVGALVDLRQSVVSTLSDQREITLYVAHKLSRQWNAQAWLYAGTTTASPDAGGGASLGYQF
ncbi:MAG: transporter [Rhodocyclaceae bacterium]|nr:transporter [Rhodocyclaceae bacterium]